MSISFNEVPSNWRVPLAWAEFDSSQAVTGPSVKTYKALVVGQKLAAGTTAELTVFSATSLQQVVTAAGDGSQLAAMAAAWFENNNTVGVDFCAIDDAGGSAAATGSLALTGTASAAGTLYIKIGGRSYNVAIASGVTASAAGDLIDTAIAADTSARVSSSNTTGTVAITALNKGESGNDLDIRLNYVDGQALPAGLAVTPTAMSSGSGNPDMDEITAVLGERQYDFVVFPWSDTTNFTKYDTELQDRWGALRSIEGGGFFAKVETHSNLITYFDARNSEFLTGLAVPSMPTPPDELAAMYAGAAARSIPNDPARPLGTLELIGAQGPNQATEFTNSEQNLLLQDGASTAYIDDGGAMRIMRAITTYQTNALGATDTAFLDITTLYTLGYLRYDWRNTVNTKYSRFKVANDGTRFAAGQKVVTPKTIKAEACAKYLEWENVALVEDFDTFKDQLIVERNSSNPTRIDVYFPPDLVNPLTVLASVIAFKL